jgi:hypothetical protein
MHKTKLAVVEHHLAPLSADEMELTNGGSIWGDIAYVVGVTLKSYVVFCSTASGYQSSLPANLKK